MYPYSLQEKTYIWRTSHYFRWQEGFGSAWTMKHNKKIQYGCWFYHAPGRNVEMKLPSPFYAKTRNDVHKFLGYSNNTLDGDDKYWCRDITRLGYIIQCM